MTSNFYNMTDSTGASGFLPTATFTSDTNVFTSGQRITQLSSIPGSPLLSMVGAFLLVLRKLLPVIILPE